MTRQKRAVAAVLAETNEFTSAQELHARLREHGERVGLATVYAQLRALAEAGVVDSLRSESGESLYRRCGLSGHHHHLVCRQCGRAVELDAPEVEAWARTLGRRHGFSELDHVLEITGLCDRCAPEAQHRPTG
ncbi:MAG TPA: transcriptional repressor [Acidimicrobiales bacterium]|nr:transcriptional repressor [Acidimicrobiales bacterium]